MDPETEQLYAEATSSLLPSLGYLDEALSFIASERVRLTAARVSTASNSSVANEGEGASSSSSKDQLERDDGGGLPRHRQEGEGEGEDQKDSIGKVLS